MSATLSQPDPLSAMCAYIAEFSSLDTENIFQGYQNKSVLPQKSNNYAICTLLNSTRIGTNTKETNNTEQTIQTLTQVRVPVQVDIYGNSQIEALQNMQACYNLFRDTIAVNFLSPYNLVPLGAGDIKDMTNTDKSNQYVFRYSCDFELSYWTRVTTAQDYFNSANPVIRNVDVNKAID